MTQKTRKKTAEKSNSFRKGDFVVYPTHGLGKITGRENKVIGDDSCTMLVIFFEEEKMTMSVPLERADELGLRCLSSKDRMRLAMTTLQGTPKVKRTMWNRRAQEYESKINSGDPVSIAEVVRDLFRKGDQAEQSYSERQMYQAALERLVREYAAVESIDQENATRRLEDFLEKAA